MKSSTQNPLPSTSLLGLSSFRGRRIRLGVKLPLTVIGLLLLAFTAYTIISIQLSQTALTDTLKNNLQLQTESKAELIRSSLIWTRSVAIDLAAVAESTNYKEEDLLKVIQNTLARNEQVFGSTIAYEPYQFRSDLYYWSPYYSRTPENKLRFTQLGNPTYNYFRWDWYSLPKEKRTPVLSPPYYDAGGGEIWMVTWSAPFFGGNEDFKGVATADIAFSETQKIVNNIKVGQRGYAFLLDSNGIILGIGENGGEFEAMVDSMVTASYSVYAEGWLNLVSEMQAGKSGFIEAADPQGIPVFVAYAPVGLETGWSLALAFPQDEIFEKATQLRNTLIAYTILVAFIFGFILYLSTRSITEPLRQLTLYASQVSAEEPEFIKDQLTQTIQIQTRDELEDLGNAFNQMAFKLKQSLENLEEKVASRTVDLERLAAELKTIADVAREIAIIRNLDTLLNVSANLIQERLNYYHVGIFLVDERGEYAILSAASSIAAEQMLARNYKLRVGKTGLVGNVTSTGQAHIALDVGLDAVHFENPYLPDTHSEIALPLRNRSITIGALDIQANVPNAFNQQDIQTLQILADQLAATIENAQLAQQVEGTLNELTRANRAQAHQIWQSTIDERSIPTYEYDGLQIKAAQQNLPPEILKKLESGRPIIVHPQNDQIAGGLENNTLLIPLMVLNQVIGVIGLEQEDPAHTWTEDEIAVAQAAANRAALTLENARLLEESQRRAAKERTILVSTARIGSAINIENILQATAEELERVLGDSEVVLQINAENISSAKGK